MRRCLIGDLLAAADCVAGLAADEQRRRLSRLLYEAHAAHRYARRFRRPHPLWGDGSLMTRALAERLHISTTAAPLDLAALAAAATAVAAAQAARQTGRRRRRVLD